MLTAAVLVGLVAIVSAHSGNMNGNWGNQPFGQGTYGYNNMGNYGHMNQQGNMGNSGMSQLMRYLSGMSGGNMGGNMGGGYMGGNMNGGMSGGNMGRNMGGGYMGGNMNGGMSGGNMGRNMGGGYMGGNMNGGMSGGNMGRGNMGGQYGGGQMSGGRHTGGMGGQQGMFGGLMMLVLQNLLHNNRADSQGNRGNDMSEDDMEYVEKIMKKKMMMEMTEWLMMNMEFKEKEADFKMAMEHMCFLVNVTYAAYKNNGMEVWNKTNDDMMEELGTKLEHMGEGEKMTFATKMVIEEKDKFAEIFLRMATWACMSGDEYMKTAAKMDGMEKDAGESEEGRH